jgi:hypothetical protein
MSHLQCPSCGLKITPRAATTDCPRCLVRGRGRFTLVPAAAVASAEPLIPSSIPKGNSAGLQAD